MECQTEEKAKPKPKPRTKASNHDDKQNCENLYKKPPQTVSVNLIEALISHTQQLDEGLDKCDNEILEKERILSALEAEFEKVQTKSNTLNAEISTLTKDNEANKEITQEIEKYLAIYERLKSDEKLFKASCNEELERLQKELDSLTADATKSDLTAQLDRNRGRLEAGKVELATINRKVASVKRQIEQVPNRMELREYRLRFSELYNQVSATHRSTKQFFSLYNSLEDTKRYLEKELSLLNSIVDSYQLACSASSGREEFLKQLQSINEGMRDTCSKVEKRHQTDKFAVETLQADIQRLLDVKVSYEKCMLELETECRKNDHLLAECKATEVKTIVKTQGSSSEESVNDEDE